MTEFASEPRLITGSLVQPGEGS
jgi:hypothetical protein